MLLQQYLSQVCLLKSSHRLLLKVKAMYIGIAPTVTRFFFTSISKFLIICSESTKLLWLSSFTERFQQLTFVLIGPGCMQLYLIPYLPHSLASDL